MMQYYRPWDLRPDEEDRINEQIKDVEAEIAREVIQFDQRRRQQSSRSIAEDPRESKAQDARQ
jgi:hypothetical protein